MVKGRPPQQSLPLSRRRSSIHRSVYTNDVVVRIHDLLLLFLLLLLCIGFTHSFQWDHHHHHHLVAVRRTTPAITLSDRRIDLPNHGRRRHGENYHMLLRTNPVHHQHQQHPIAVVARITSTGIRRRCGGSTTTITPRGATTMTLSSSSEDRTTTTNTNELVRGIVVNSEKDICC